MATRPELHIAVAKQKSKASDYNDNFDMMMQYIEDSMEDFMPSMTGNSGKILTTDGSTTSWASVSTIFQSLYPVGSIYIGTQSTCPLASMFGTWELVAANKALWTGDGTNGNTTKSAGLPNISGSVASGAMCYGSNNPTTSGAFTAGTSNNLNFEGGNVHHARTLNFSANKSNSIYGNSTTVQPPAYVVNVWRRTA